MRKKLIFFSINAGWILLGYFIFITSLKDTVLTSPWLTRNVQYLFPQGWAFFTKNPKEALIDVYRIDNNKREFVDMSNISAKNLFGFSRAARMKGYELSMVISPIPEIRWKEHKPGNLFDAVNDTTLSVKETHNFKYFNKGTYLLRLHEPVPWAWSGQNQEQYAPYKTLKVRIN